MLDPFVGSGTTIIAAEMTGRQATLDGQTFEQVKAERLGGKAEAPAGRGRNSMSYIFP